MSLGGQENQGTGLREVFDILVKATPERLLSLTFMLGESPEDNIIHALCLLILQKEERALDKLQSLGDNHLANHLAEKWQMSKGKLEVFGIQCGHFQEFTGESLAGLARIFKVLSEQRLCGPLLRNMAYKRAISSDDQNKTSNLKYLEYDPLREEAKVVCGPQAAEWICSSLDLQSGSHSGLVEGNTTLKVTDQSETPHSLPSPLQASSSMPSYPTHLEISIPPTALFQDDKRTPGTSDQFRPNTPVLHVSECEAKDEPDIVQSKTSEERQPDSNGPAAFGAKKHSKVDEALAAESLKLDNPITRIETPTKTTKPKPEPEEGAQAAATNTFLPTTPPAEEEEEEEEEEEAIFYAFVIMHAPEDENMAENISEKVKAVINREGATFSMDFAVAGKSTLKCVDDAINNTAFTFLLLTRNFDNPMQELQSHTALINAIEKKHKFNTVIPLLPQENRMPRESISPVLRTLVHLDEAANFERKIRKGLSAAMIEKQKKLWAAEQTLKKAKKTKERLKYSNQHLRQLNKECKTVQGLQREHLYLLMEQKLLLHPGVTPEQEDAGDGRLSWPHGQHIHIEHANYIMIGNESQMTVGSGGGADKEDEEQ